MKYILSLIVTISILCTSLSAVEYGYLKPSESLVLADGDVLVILSSTARMGYAEKIMDLVIDETSYEFSNDNIGNTNAGQTEANRTFAGPCTITATRLFFYKKTSAFEVEYKQVNIVSLPSSTVGAGTHEIVVEASDDLQTWTPVHSSSIGGNKAFFRTRVVEAGD